MWSPAGRIGLLPSFLRSRVLSANLDDLRAVLPAGAVLVEFRQFRPFDFAPGEVGRARTSRRCYWSPSTSRWWPISAGFSDASARRENSWMRRRQ
jgi:hypothetical protein